MKKTLIAGALTVALLGTGATGVYYASAQEKPSVPAEIIQNQRVDFQMDERFDGMWKFMEDQGVNVDEMIESMQSGNFEDMQEFMNEQNINFGQMRPHMQDMHPNLSDRELEELYKSMHGTGGSSNSNNFQGMMSNF